MPERRAADVLAPLLARPEATAVLSDFDGTLAPIVDDPAAARPLPAAVVALHRLAERYAIVGVVSGRPARFLLEHLGSGLLLSGLYGLQSVVDGEVVAHPDALPYAAAIEAAAIAAEGDGLQVERKGLTVTLHYRVDPASEPFVRAVAEREVERHGLALHVARMSYELRPPLPRDKGTVVAEVAGRSEAVVFFGDDIGDLDAFVALDGLAAQGVHAVKVGVRSAEAPAELMDAADLVVDGPAGVVKVLDVLARA